MPLARTLPRTAANRPDDPVARPPARSVAIVAVLLLLILSGCSTGNARDAGVAQGIEETKAATVPGVQATFIASEYFGASPTPPGTPTPRAVLRAIGLTTGVSGSGAPDGIYGAVPADAGRIYLAVRAADLQDGQTLFASWQTIEEKPEDIEVFGTSEVTVEGSPEWVALPLDLTGARGPDTYAVTVYVGETLLGALSFEITGAGTAPRRID